MHVHACRMHVEPSYMHVNGGVSSARVSPETHKRELCPVRIAVHHVPPLAEILSFEMQRRIPQSPSPRGPEAPR